MKRRIPVRRPAFIRDGVCVVPLTRGYEAICDAELLDKVAPFNWSARVAKNGCVYAERTNQIGDKRFHLPLHRVVLGLAHDDPRHSDHIDGNTLDNRRVNLRTCTLAENGRNLKVPPRNTSGYKGVSRNSKNRWKAEIRHGDRLVYLGVFATREHAALAYNRAAVELFGEFARLNVIGESAA